MSQSRKFNEILQKSLSLAIHYFENRDIPEEVRKTISANTVLNFNKGIAWALYSRGFFMGEEFKATLTDENTSFFLDALDNPDIVDNGTGPIPISVRLNDKTLNCNIDITTLNELLKKGGLTEAEMDVISYRYKAIFDSCLFAAYADYLFPTLMAEMTQALLNKTTNTDPDKTNQYQQEHDELANYLFNCIDLFEVYGVDNFIRPYMGFLQNRYDTNLKEHEIEELKFTKQDRSGSIKAHDFLQGLDFLTDGTTYSFDKNSNNMIKLSIRNDNGDDRIPFLYKMNIGKVDNNYEIYFKEPTKLNTDKNIYSNSTEIFDKDGKIVSLTVPTPLAVDILKHLKVIESDNHEGLTAIKAISTKITADCKSGNWNADDFHSIVKKCQDKTGHTQTRLLANPRDPGVDLLYRAIAQYQENSEMYPEIKTLEQLMLTQQKRDLMKTFDSEIERLLPDFSPVQDMLQTGDSNLKVDGYRLGKRMLAQSGIDEPPNEVLVKNTFVTDSRGKKYVNENRGYATLEAALLSKRGFLRSKSAGVWNEATKKYKHPREILEKIMPKESRNFYEIFKNTPSLAVHYFDNRSILEWVHQKNKEIPVPNDIRHGWAWALHSSKDFMGDDAKISDDNVNNYLDALDNQEIIDQGEAQNVVVELNNERVNRTLDVHRVNSAFTKYYGISKTELEGISYRDRVLLHSSIFAAEGDFLDTEFHKIIAKVNEDTDNPGNLNALKEVMGWRNQIKNQFEKYVGDHLIRPYIAFLDKNYDINLKETDINELQFINQNNSGSIKADDFLQGLNYLTGNTTYSFDKNSHDMIKLSVRHNQDNAIPFLDRMDIGKVNDNYEICFKEPIKTNADNNIYSNTTEIYNSEGKTISLQVPSLLAINIIEQLKVIDFGYHSGLKAINELSNKIFTDCKSGKWNPVDFHSIVEICQDRTNYWKSLLSGFSLFGIANERDSDVDLLYRAIAQYEENIKMYPEIKTMEELMLTQQKRDLMKTFDSEIERLLPDLYIGPDEESNMKVDAYLLGREMLAKSGINESLFDALTKDHQLKNKGGIPYVNKDNNEIYSIGRALLSKRGIFSSKSATVWNDAIGKYKHPNDMLKKLIPVLGQQNNVEKRK